MFLLFFDVAKNKRKQPTVAAYTTALTFLGLLSFECFSIAQWIGGRLITGHNDGAISGWEGDHLTPNLAIALHRCLSFEGNINVSDLPLGIYSLVFASWTTLTSLKTLYLKWLTIML